MMAWTPDRIERLRKLHSQSLSASQIAAELGGVTRNGVIGKLHRLGISAAMRRPPPARPAEPRIRKVRAPVAARQPEPPAAPQPTPAVLEPPKQALVPLVELTRKNCHWPTGHPGDPGFGFCGAQAAPDRPYCAYHWRMAHQVPGQQHRRKAART